MIETEKKLSVDDFLQVALVDGFSVAKKTVYALDLTESKKDRLWKQIASLYLLKTDQGGNNE